MIRVLILSLAMLTACTGSQTRRAVTVAIVTSGSALNEIEVMNLSAYRAATDALGMRFHGPDYVREVAPVDAEFAARNEQIQLLATSLVAAAALTDASKSGDIAAYRRAAVQILGVIERAMVVLERGGLLAPIVIPASVTTVIGALRTLIGAAS